MLGTEGLKRIINSAKVQLLAGAAFSAVALYLLTPGTSLEKRDLLTKMVYTMGALVGAVILGWAHEDAAKKRGIAQQVNVQSDVANPPTPAPEPDEPDPEPVPVPVVTEPPPFTPAQLEALKQVFSSVLAPHLKPRAPVPQPSATELPQNTGE